MGKSLEQYFAVTAPGFEGVCAAELRAQAIEVQAILRGGVAFAGQLRDLYLANLHLRSASRVLVRLGGMTVRDFPTLFKRLVRLPWGRFVRPGSACDIRVTCHGSRLSHSGRIAETCREAIGKALGDPVARIASEQKVFIRIVNDHCQVSMDSSGDLLHRRGYRVASVAAPLRETLAAACLLTLGYDGSRPLIDAMTGSGTFAIEAALIALKRAPGAKRSFAFMRWPKFRPGLWQQLVQEAQREESADLVSPIIAIDNNVKAIAAAEQNLEVAGLADIVRLNYGSIQQLRAEQPSGLLICNPPYGERLGRTAALQTLYREIGRVYSKTFAAWQGALVCPDAALARTTGIAFKSRVRFSNGGISAALLEKVPETQKS
ncbi:MAG: class I SAM-dependent RNA methyltransferase [Desulfuromonadales bacterium]|nr:class I SAM-dependent RNA methyltransferase [Desulfuromonadales bacterium]